MIRKVHGVDVFYTEGGNGETKVLLLHGWGCDHKMMQPVAAA